ncbi:MAG: hypothetical protein EA428_12880 [Spirochaetaceae bacterium]|nr:MAG: hypothetical protein EA428_12880 [Spirochaetaceae bacterium]
MEPNLARFRAGLMRELRAFFSDRDFLEVETPRLAPYLIPEAHLEVFSTEYLRTGSSVPLYLIPSPELWLKQLIPRGYGNLFEIGKCFRNEEQMGSAHNPEFTMLEWYMLNADYLQSLQLFTDLLQALCGALADSPGADASSLRRASQPIETVTVRDAVRDHSGIDLAEHGSDDSLRRAAQQAGLSIGQDDDWNTVFDRLMLDMVEPHLPADRPVALIDYPARVSTLATPSGANAAGGFPSPDTAAGGLEYQTVERWELYLAGLELVNCYSEEIDPGQIREFFAREQQKKRSMGRSEHAVPPDFPAVFEQPYPRCSGGAMGVDRLMMALTGRKRMNEVIFFSLSDTLFPR